MCYELTNEELIELRKEYDTAEPKRKKEIEEIVVRAHLGLCKNIVNADFRIYENDRDDLISIGLHQVFICFKKWKYDEAQFKTYLNRDLRWKMQLYSYGINNIIDVDRNILTKANIYKNEIGLDDERASAEELQQIADKYGVSVKQVEKALKYLDMKSGNSLWIDTEEEHVFLNLPSNADIGKNIEAEEKNKTLATIIRSYCDNDLDFEIFRMCFDPFDEGFQMSVAEIAENVNRTISMVSRKIKKIKDRILEDEDKVLYQYLKNNNKKVNK